MALDQNVRSEKALSNMMTPNNRESTSRSNSGKKSVPLHTSLSRLSRNQPEISAGQDEAGSPGGMSFKTEATWEAFGKTESETNDEPKKKRKGKRPKGKSDEAFDTFDDSFQQLGFGDDDDGWEPFRDSISDNDQNKRQPKEGNISKSDKSSARNKSKNMTHIGNASTGNLDFAASDANERLQSDTRVNPSVGIRRIEKKTATKPSPKVIIGERIPSDLSSNSMTAKGISPPSTPPPSLSRTPSNRRRRENHRDTSKENASLATGLQRTHSPTQLSPNGTTQSESVPPRPPASSRTPPTNRTRSNRRGRGNRLDDSPATTWERIPASKPNHQLSSRANHEQSKSSSRNTRKDNSTGTRNRRNIRRIKSSDLQEFQLRTQKGNSDELASNGSSKEPSVSSSGNTGKDTSPAGIRDRRNIRRIKSSDLQEFQLHTQKENSDELASQGSSKEPSVSSSGNTGKNASPAGIRDRRNVRRIKTSDLQEFRLHTKKEKSGELASKGSSKESSVSASGNTGKDTSPAGIRDRRNVRRINASDLQEFRLHTQKEKSGELASKGSSKESSVSASGNTGKPSHNSSSGNSDRRRTLGRSRSYKRKTHIGSSGSANETSARRIKAGDLQEVQFHTQKEKSGDSASATPLSKSPSHRPVYVDSEDDAGFQVKIYQPHDAVLNEISKVDPSKEPSDRRKGLGRSASSELRKHIVGTGAATKRTSGESASHSSLTPSHNSSSGNSDRRRTLGRSRSYKLKTHIGSSGSANETKSSGSGSLISSTRSHHTQQSDRGSSSNRLSRQKSGDSLQSGGSSEKPATPARSARRRREAPRQRGVARAKSSDDALGFSWSSLDSNRNEPLGIPRKHRSMRGLGARPTKGSSRLQSSKRELRLPGDQGTRNNDGQHDKGFITSFLGSATPP
jgi:hypothetical protein